MKFYDIKFDTYVHEAKKLTDQYLLAMDWMTSLGMPFSKTRFGEYKRTIDLFSNGDFDNEKESEELFHKLLNAHGEVSEIVRIHDQLKDNDGGDFIEQLKKVTGGQEFRNISSKDQSRDFSFELSMAARFIKGGFEVVLNKLADIEATKNGCHKVYVECKRIKSRSKISSNVKKANEQLRKRISRDRSSQSRGLVAINVNELINPNNSMIVSPTTDSFQVFNSRNLDRFVVDNERDINSNKFNKCLGVFCEQSDQAIIYERDPLAIANCRGAKLYQYINKGKDLELLKLLAINLANQDAFS